MIVPTTRAWNPERPSPAEGGGDRTPINGPAAAPIVRLKKDYRYHFVLKSPSREKLNALLRTMNEIVGTKLEPIYQEPRAGDVRDSQADISKAKKLLGYTPVVSLQEGLKKTLDWCRASHPAGVRG